MQKIQLILTLLALLFLNKLYAASPQQSIIGEWKMIHEYGEKHPSFEIMSFSDDGRFAISNGTCGKYSISAEKITLTISQLTREFTITFQWKIDQENLKFGKDITQSNTYARTLEKTKPCNLTSDWQPIKDNSFTFLLPKDWIYKTEKQANGQHYRLMIANKTAEKTIMLMATKLLKNQANSVQVLNSHILDSIQKINAQTSFTIDYKLDQNNQFPQYRINHGVVYYGESAIFKSFVSGDKVGDWNIMILITQRSDQLLEIPEILKSLRFDESTIIQQP